MKKTIMIMMLILCLPLVFSMYGGDSVTLYDGSCAEIYLNISISPIQNDNEYTLNNECNLQTINDNLREYKCDCINNKTKLILTPLINSKGRYDISLIVYNYKDNETKTLTVNNFTNNLDTNQTVTITLSDNITLHRIIEPNEMFNYVETKEGYIIIPDNNVTFETVQTDNDNINLVLSSHGYKCFDIYTENGIPNSIKVNGTSVIFTYNSTEKLINFCTTFSTKSISLSWASPSTPSSPGSSSSNSNSKCKPAWECSDWSDCVNNTRNRTCISKNNCYLFRPELSEDCISPQIPKKVTDEFIEYIEDVEEEDKAIVIDDGKIIIEPDNIGNGLSWIIGILIVIITVCIGIYVFKRLNKKPREPDEKV